HSIFFEISSGPLLYGPPPFSVKQLQELHKLFILLSPFFFLRPYCKSELPGTPLYWATENSEH
ncbi:unnamed protein product, partial [Musa acuminata var. zebrina]